MTDAPVKTELKVKTAQELRDALKKADRERYERFLAQIKGRETLDLINSVKTTEKPLYLWEYHRELEARGIPPILRGNGDHSCGLEGELVNLCADIAWLQKQYPHQTVLNVFRGWLSVLKSEVDTPKWHQHMQRQFRWLYPRGGMSRWLAQGLDLSDDQRRDLVCAPTTQLKVERYALHGDKFLDLERFLAKHADAKRTGGRTKEQVGERRARLWRLHVLTGKSATTTARFWNLIGYDSERLDHNVGQTPDKLQTPTAITRQAVQKQLDKIEETLELRKKEERAARRARAAD